MGLSTERKIVITLLILSASSLFFTPPLVIRLIFGFLQAYYLPGLVFLLFLGDRRRPRFDNLYLPILISPIIISLLVLAVYRFTGSFNTSIKISLSVLYILLVTALFTGKFRHTERDSTVPGSILLLSFLFCGVVTITYLVNRYILVYTDAWYHVSVVYEILDRGIPPMDPRLPDIPIRYMWFYHLFQAIWKELSGLSITHVLGFFNIINAFAFPYLIARLTSIFTKDRLYILSAPVFAFVGLESAGWVLWPLSVVRAFFGDVGGTAELARIISGIELNGVKVIYFLKAPWTWLMSLPDKFLTITAFSYTLNLFLLCFILVLAGGFHKRSSFKAAASIFLTMIGALLFHVVTGLGLILTAIGAGMLL
ncbi:MAG: hypothetical protein KAX38_08600, partial [Candidatus Krumholzibacteria bacterium]|nr:hypothetical protein [Candidatus Krumholzibacteria bacterium]